MAALGWGGRLLGSAGFEQKRKRTRVDNSVVLARVGGYKGHKWLWGNTIKINLKRDKVYFMKERGREERRIISGKKKN